jgi:hypothetical protein
MAIYGFGMPPPGFDQLIAQKYAMEKQRTDALSAAQNAEANLTNVKAGLLPAESQADVAKTTAETTGQNITNQFLPQTLGANIFRTNAEGTSLMAQSKLYGAQRAGLLQMQQPMSPSSLGLFAGGF